MSELRRDPLMQHWVIIAPERARRPHDRRMEDVPLPEGYECPFCEGNEFATPQELLRFQSGGEHAWDVRVVPNRYPALSVEGTLDRRTEGRHDHWTGIGAHEVIIESPQHETQMHRLSVRAIADVFRAYRERLIDLARDERLVYGQVFKNCGQLAGASLEHVHSQLIALPFVPPAVAREFEAAERHFQASHDCIHCLTVQDELASRARIVAESERFVAFCPFAGRFAFETWLYPRSHTSHFESTSNEDLLELAELLKRLLKSIATISHDTPYNYYLHTAPFRVSGNGHLHWHLEISPRLTPVAGFEWGSGVFINPVAPEEAAEFLRKSAKPAQSG